MEKSDKYRHRHLVHIEIHILAMGHLQHLSTPVQKKISVICRIELNLVEKNVFVSKVYRFSIFLLHKK